MRAIVVEKHGWLEGGNLQDIPVPAVGPNQVLIDVKASGVNFTDLLMMNGGYQSTPPLPFIPGMEVAGTVSSVGSEVRELRVGDRVACHAPYGGFAEKLAAQVTHCHPLPDEVSFDIAAAMGMVYETAYLALHERAGIKARDVVLINGASGGVGVAAIEIAKACGATVLAGLTSPGKHAIAEDAGADAIIDLSVSDLSEQLRDHVYKLTGGRGVDIVIDPIGGAVFEASIRVLARRGRIVSVGFASGKIPIIKANYLLLKTILATGFQSAQVRNLEPELASATHASVMGLLRRGLLRPRIQGRYSLSKFREALTVINDRKVQGRNIIC